MNALLAAAILSAFRSDHSLDAGGRMNWKRVLSRTYIVLWALFAILGAVVLALGSKVAEHKWTLWAFWLGVCLLLPAIGYWLLLWIVTGFTSVERSQVEQRPSATQPTPNTLRGYLWPDITDVASARTAASIAAYAALCVAGATTVFVILGAFNVMKLAGPEALWDAAIFVILGLIILSRTSRVAAILTLVAYVAERVYMTATTGTITGFGFMTIFFTIYFINGVRGTFAYHRFRELNAVGSHVDSGSSGQPGPS